jgi:hypothetical protein
MSSNVPKGTRYGLSIQVIYVRCRVCDTGLVYPGYRTLTNISASLVARKTGPNYDETYSDD